MTNYDYGYPHPDDVTPEIKALMDADLSMDRKRQTARGRRKKALEDAGFTYIGSNVLACDHWKKGDVYLILDSRKKKVKVTLPASAIPLLFPSLTEEERNALVFFSEGAQAAYSPNDPFVREQEQAIRNLLNRLGGDTP